MDTRITQRGLAKLQTTAGALDAYANVIITGVKGKHQWDNQILKDFGGSDAAWDARNEHVTISVSIELTAASAADAIPNGAFLEPLAEVTLTGFDLDWLNATGIGGAWVGNWCYFEGGEIDLSNTKVATTQISLRKYKDANQNAAQFTIPT